MSGGRAEVNEHNYRYRSDHTARKGELQALLIGANSGSQVSDKGVEYAGSSETVAAAADVKPAAFEACAGALDRKEGS